MIALVCDLNSSILLTTLLPTLFRKETHRARRGVRPCAQCARSDVHGAGRRDGQRRSHPAAAEQPAQVLPGGARQDDARRHRQEPPRPAGF